MKSIRLLIPLFAVMLLAASCAGDDDDNNSSRTTVKNANANNARQNADLGRLEFPHVKGGSSVVIVHKCLLNSRTGETGVNYSVEWDAMKRAQRWSCYQMYESLREGNTSRYYANSKKGEEQYPHDDFLLPDYQLPNDPYWGSGYDHGHICPSADRLSSFECNYQTFYLTNMQPQVNAFNANVWANMEGMVRTWNRNSFRDTLYVCKGGTIDDKNNILRYIGTGASQIPVPKYFFMALLCKNSQGYKAMAFWIEHKAGYDDGNALKQYVISIDELEEKTGIDFFCNLPDDIEDSVEQNVYLNSWGFK
jgi:endonuclease G